MSHPAPLPPLDLPQRELPIEDLPVGTFLFRFHRLEHHPTYFDKSQSGRFNSPDAGYGVLYAALERRGAFAETLLRNSGQTLLFEEDDIKSRACATYSLIRSLRVVRLHGFGLPRIGATASVCSCQPPHGVPQAWSSALYHHPAQADGILYRSRHDDDARCLALFDRAADALGSPTEDLPLRDGWFFELMDLYGAGLA